jgi:prevent-host-death family protein
MYNKKYKWRNFIGIMIRRFVMIQIRPVSDLRNRFTEIEATVKNGSPVYLTKNGYGSMVVMSIEAYSKLTESVEDALDVADKMAEDTTERYTHEEMFAKLREVVND